MIRGTQWGPCPRGTAIVTSSTAFATRRDVIRELNLSVRKHPSMTRLNRATFFQDSVHWDGDGLLSSMARAPRVASVRLLLLLVYDIGGGRSSAGLAPGQRCTVPLDCGLPGLRLDMVLLLKRWAGARCCSCCC